jgi:hypothetical protein
MTSVNATFIILGVLLTGMLLAMIRLPAALVIAGLYWFAAWKLGVL